MQALLDLLQVHSLIVCLFLTIFLGEAFVLWLLRWGTPWRAFFDSFISNLIAIVFLYQLVARIYPPKDIWLIYFPYTVIADYAVLRLLKRHSAKKTLQAAILINLTSCLINILWIASAMLLGWPRFVI